jgi:mannose-6-phosphate isomerase-like protein (cupin superfamily)
LTIPRNQVHGFAAEADAVLYVFTPHHEDGLRFVHVETIENAKQIMAGCDRASLPEIGDPTHDVRSKYWGRIETILDSDIAGKRIFIEKNRQSSLEFHVEKHETYYIHSGRLKIGLRIGRAENHSILLGPGDSYDVRPGVMHMRMALEDTVIIEASTRDSDADSFLVEDGQTYRHIDVQTVTPQPKMKGQRA